MLEIEKDEQARFWLVDTTDKSAPSVVMFSPLSESHHETSTHIVKKRSITEEDFESITASIERINQQ